MALKDTFKRMMGRLSWRKSPEQQAPTPTKALPHRAAPPVKRSRFPAMRALTPQQVKQKARNRVRNKMARQSRRINRVH